MSTSTGVAALPPVGEVGIDKMSKVLKCDLDSKPKRAAADCLAARLPGFGAR